MLSRRQLRIKVMQALYAYFQDDKHDLHAAEKELFRGIEKSYDLYLTLLALLTELVHEEERYITDKPKSKLQVRKTEPLRSVLGENLFLKSLRNNTVLMEALKRRKISWQSDYDMVTRIYQRIKKSPAYLASDENGPTSWETDVNFVAKFYQDHIAGYENLQQLLEEKNVYYTESMSFINSMVLKNIKAAARSAEKGLEVYPLFKDDEDDRDFVKNLFLDTITTKLITEKYIEEKSTNWDIDRIALLDVIILKMAISEIVRFSSIPVKVSINEYIDLSKEYSTPKSSIFVNGVLDKIVIELKEQGKVVKVGRGLME